MKKVVFLICVICGLNSLYGSEPFESNKKHKSDNTKTGKTITKADRTVDFIYPVWGFYVNGSLGYSTISNNSLEGVWAPEGGVGYLFGAGYFRSLSPYVKLIAGLDISSVSAKIETGDLFLVEYGANDIDGTPYMENMQVSATEILSPIYVSIPLLFEFGNPNIDRIGFYFDIGFRFSYLINSGYEKSGDYVTKGTYNDEYYNVTLEDVPELGFYGDIRGENGNMNERGVFNPTAELSKTNISLQAGLGISIPISSSIIFKGGIVTHYGLVDISNSSDAVNSTNDRITDAVYDKRSKYIDNSFAVNEGSETRYFGFEFGIYINRLLK